jgi:hypothetical protein
MDILEIIKVVAEVAIALFTLALVRATYVLAKHTEVMSARDADRQRIEDIERCISLAESIVGLGKEEFGNFYAGELSASSIHPFNKLLALSKYFHNSGLRMRLEYIITILTSDLLSGNVSFFTNQPFKETLTKLRSELIDEIKELHKDLEINKNK